MYTFYYHQKFGTFQFKLDLGLICSFFITFIFLLQSHIFQKKKRHFTLSVRKLFQNKKLDTRKNYHPNIELDHVKHFGNNSLQILLTFIIFSIIVVFSLMKARQVKKAYRHVTNLSKDKKFI
jgi:predicted RND superfamily exporter protein